MQIPTRPRRQKIQLKPEFATIASQATKEFRKKRFGGDRQNTPKRERVLIVSDEDKFSPCADGENSPSPDEDKFSPCADGENSPSPDEDKFSPCADGKIRYRR